jgi:hypothetical protein
MHIDVAVQPSEYAAGARSRESVLRERAARTRERSREGGGLGEGYQAGPSRLGLQSHSGSSRITDFADTSHGMGGEENPSFRVAEQVSRVMTQLTSGRVR